MTILLAGGGTAGHINPAISIADFIKARKPEAKIYFAGTPKGLENTLVEKAGYPLLHVEIYGFKRKLTASNIKAVTKLIPALRRAKEIIEEIKPDIVIGTGGYVSGPVLFAAARLGIPTAIHEQNAYPGMTSRILARLVDRVMISFDASKKYFKNEQKLSLVGNPIRSEMLFKDREASKKELGLPEDKPFVLSFGGSLGARELNERMLAFIGLHTKENKIYHMHATGKFGWRWMPDRLSKMGLRPKEENLDVREYIYNMASAMAAADLVICRAGAITLGELAVCGKPSILIPSPNVTNNHQYYNALAFSEAGAAIIQLEKNATGETLYSAAMTILEDKNKLSSMSAAASSLAIFDSTQKIYDIIFDLIRSKNGKSG